jgi:hypothetical protein
MPAYQERISTISHLSKVPSLSGSTHPVKNKKLKIHFLSQPLHLPISRILPISQMNVNTLSVKRTRERPIGLAVAPTSRGGSPAHQPVATEQAWIRISIYRTVAYDAIWTVEEGANCSLKTPRDFPCMPYWLRRRGRGVKISGGTRSKGRRHFTRGPATRLRSSRHSLSLNSPSRARTCDLAVNSRSLYLLSYRGIYPKAKPALVLRASATVST